MAYNPRSKPLIDLAENFLLTFPLADDPHTAVEVTLTAFDSWADVTGYYAGVDTGNADAMNAARGMLRGRLNRAGIHPRWVKDGNPPFQLDLESYPRPTQNLDGKYHLKRAAVALADASVLLPAKVSNILTTRKQQILDRLRGAGPDLSPMIRIQAEQLLRNIDNWGARTLLDAQLLEKDCIAFRKSLLASAPQPAGLLDRPGE